MEANTEFYRVKFYGQKNIFFFCLGYTYKFLIYSQIYTVYFMNSKHSHKFKSTIPFYHFLTLPPPICSLKLSYEGQLLKSPSANVVVWSLLAFQAVEETACNQVTTTITTHTHKHTVFPTQIKINCANPVSQIEYTLANKRS